MTSNTISRRTFLKSSAAALLSEALILPFATPASAAEAGSASAWQMNFLRVDSSGHVTVISPVAELGQGTSSALTEVLANALDADWSKVKFELAPVAPQYVNPTYGMQLTGASTGMSGFHDLLQQAGAAARSMLITAAAQKWSLPADRCTTSAGRVLLPGTGKQFTYGELASAAARLPVPKPSSSPVTGPQVSSKPRLDIPGKVDGTAIYAIDVKLPQMLYAAVTMAPVFGANLQAYDTKAALSVRGVRGVTPVPYGIGVVADGWWSARKGLTALNTKWAATANDNVNDRTIRESLHQDLKTQRGHLAKSDGDPESVLKDGATLTRRYDVPFVTHATMEPMTCVAKVDQGRCDIWVGSQQPGRARREAAELLKIPEESVTVHATLAGGGFGRRQEPDFVLQAVALAQAHPGRPVKLIWSREEDTQHSWYRPAGVSELSASLSGGMVKAWRHRQATQPVLERAFPAVSKMVPYDITVSDGIFPLYKFANQDAWWVKSSSHVPVGMWRSVGASQTIFAIESFMDEIATELGKDPYEFRREHLRHDARAIAAWDRLGTICDWERARKDGRAIGFAISHKNDDCLVAQAAELVRVGGGFKVAKIWSVADAGRVIAPDSAKSQIEGAAVWALSAALYGQITIDGGRVKESNFHDYPVVRLGDAPEFHTEFIESGGKIEGMGEGGAPGIAPAVCNALFRLTGNRVRSLPILPQSA